MISRRTFAKGLVGGAAAVTAPHALTGAAFAGQSTQAWYAETTLWDSEVDPHVNYHVHGLAVLPDDTVVVATEGRHEVSDAGPRDLLVRRSTDGGATWTPTQTVVASVDGTAASTPTPGI
ncbi:sialidase family protein [Plantactinospora sp. ZYX-F-223]|uniref:sialidase family protein n=1 Tax=Plantactinospora sp. ZYX-F-223 TaxID=3144103 RepID=UPI0031FCE75D